MLKLNLLHRLGHICKHGNFWNGNYWKHGRKSVSFPENMWNFNMIQNWVILLLYFAYQPEFLGLLNIKLTITNLKFCLNPVYGRAPLFEFFLKFSKIEFQSEFSFYVQLFLESQNETSLQSSLGTERFQHFLRKSFSKLCLDILFTSSALPWIFRTVLLISLRCLDCFQNSTNHMTNLYFSTVIFYTFAWISYSFSLPRWFFCKHEMS